MIVRFDTVYSTYEYDQDANAIRQVSSMHKPFPPLSETDWLTLTVAPEIRKDLKVFLRYRPDANGHKFVITGPVIRIYEVIERDLGDELRAA